MKRIIFTLLISLLLTVPAMQAAPPTEAQRQQWLKEMTQLKHDYMVKELKLSKEQQAKFFPLYDAMDAEVRKIGAQTRQMERSVRKKGDKATDLERTKAAEAAFELKQKEGAIEMRYFNRFKTVLTAQQLLLLKRAERHFNREMIKQSHKMKK